MLTYFELLELVKHFKEPKKVLVKLTNDKTGRYYKATYDIDDTFICYVIENKNQENEDYKYYLSECYLESSMFNRNIEIVGNGDLEPLKLKQFHNNQRKLATKINEIIEYIKEK